MYDRASIQKIKIDLSSVHVDLVLNHARISITEVILISTQRISSPKGGSLPLTLLSRHKAAADASAPPRPVDRCIVLKPLSAITRASHYPKAGMPDARVGYTFKRLQSAESPRRCSVQPRFTSGLKPSRALRFAPTGPNEGAPLNGGGASLATGRCLRFTPR